MIKELHDTLLKLYKQRGAEFSGIGILVCDDISDLPISSLYKQQAPIRKANLFDQLVEVSNYKNTRHDGISIISSNLELTHIAQYFYPKPGDDFLYGFESEYGVRYFITKLGSSLSSVKYSAVVGNNYGVCIFIDGIKIEGF